MLHAVRASNGRVRLRELKERERETVRLVIVPVAVEDSRLTGC